MFVLKAYLIVLSAAWISCEEAASTAPKEESGVLVLTKNNFEATLASKKHLLVEFYAPWCGHCKDLAPKYEAAAKELAKRDPPLEGILAKVDATVEADLAAKYEVQGYPTLKFFRDGKFESDYDGDRSTDGLVTFVAQRADPNYKPPPPATLFLTADNFTSTVEENEFVLVEFYAPWCGHCKALAPEYEKAAKQLAKEDPPIPLAVVDATKEVDVAKKFGVTGYPTLKLFRKGKAFEYKGPRHADGIVEYMIKNRNDAAIKVESMADFKKNAPPTRPAILGYFPDLDNPLLKTFIEVTNEAREDFVSMVTSSEEVVKKFDLRPYSFAIIQPELLGSKFEKSVLIYDKTDATAEEVKKYIQSNSIPLVGHYTFDTTKAYDEANKERTLCLVFYSVDFEFDHRAATQMWRSKIAVIANNYKDRVIFAVASDEEQEEKLRAFGLGETGTDMNIGCANTEGTKFGMPEMDEYDADHIISFIDDVLAGKAKPFLKSQPVPARQTGPVKVAVANNFAELVTDNPNDVVVEFYAPWCGHCKKFEPIYANMARRLQSIKTLTVVKIDATANDAPPGYKVQGFPTIFFKPSDSKKPIKFEGGRTEFELISNMARHAVASKKPLTDEVLRLQPQAKNEKQTEEAPKKDEL